MPGKPSLSSDEKSALFGGTISTLVGLLLVLVSIDIIPADPDSFHAPRWVLTLVGLMFAFTGLLIFSTGLFSPAERRHPVVMWIQYFLTVGMLAAFATVFLWVGFGPGEREFSSSASFLFFAISSKGNEVIGRILFGGFGLILALITTAVAIGGAQKIMTGTIDKDSANE